MPPATPLPYVPRQPQPVKSPELLRHAQDSMLNVMLKGSRDTMPRSAWRPIRGPAMTPQAAAARTSSCNRRLRQRLQTQI